LNFLLVAYIYRDEVWCDVVAMNACHLLLGRPWQFDRKAQYDGRAKTYSFRFDRYNIRLIPTKEPSPEPRKEVNVTESSHNVVPTSVVIGSQIQSGEVKGRASVG